ncbi:ABC transporter permease [Bacillus sp. OK048]|uniref:ABC transporter permease n=1 Tax=Bacillus sp. OK048 TaxID=1882761 RepID=UPI00088026AD|nr:ABC transporter permease subunit [Bacillus sp. OK048]SDL92221.1 putative spermidine/putrescine transport system permease protein [Bacillus sp. OK048]
MVKKTFNIVLVGILALFICLPFIPLAIWSFTKYWPWPMLVPDKWSIDSWEYLFSFSGRAYEGMLNSFIVAGLTLFGNIVLGIPAARGLAQNEFKGKNIVFAVLLAPLFIPYTLSIIGMHDVALQFDFLNDYVGVALAHILVTLPYFIASIWFQYRLMGTKLGEAAFVLGANEWKIFLWIEFPLLIPSILLGSLLVLIISFSQYLPTWIMSGGTLLTLPLVIFPYASSGNSSIVSAYSLLFFAPIIILLLIYFVLLRINNKNRFLQ